jgi:hypothetical protein
MTYHYQISYVSLPSYSLKSVGIFTAYITSRIGRVLIDLIYTDPAA